MKLEITNNSRAPQGVHTMHGVKFVHPNETKTLDIPKEWHERLHTLEDAGVLAVKDPRQDAARQAADEEAQRQAEEAQRAAQEEAARLASINADAIVAGQVPGALPPNLQDAKPNEPPAPIARFEARHLGGGRWGIFLKDERVGDETFSKDEAAAEVEKRNAPLNAPIEQKA